MKNKILLITAHADDHVAFAGTVFKLEEKGYEVYELLLTDSGEGADKRKAEIIQKRGEIVRLREEEFGKATKFLGVKRKFILGEEDLNLKYSKELMLRVLKIIREVKPKIILTMNFYDYHPDHIAAAELAAKASFWAATGIRSEYGSPHRTEIVLFAEGMLPIKPDVLVDITKSYSKKVELFKIYESQVNSKSLCFFKGLASVRGYHLRKRKSKEYAEGFNLNKKFPSLLFEDL